MEQLLWATVHRPKSESRRQLPEACVFSPRQSLPCLSLGFLTSQVCRQSGLLCPSGGGRKAPGKGKPPCTKLRCWGCCRAVGCTVLSPGHSPPPVSDTLSCKALSPALCKYLLIYSLQLAEEPGDSPCATDGETGLERLSNLPKVTQLAVNPAIWL